MKLPLADEFNAEMRALTESGACLPLYLAPAEAFSLLSTLQLALRHPKMVGQAAELARKVAEEIEERLCKTPALKEVAAMGWRPECDIKD